MLQGTLFPPESSWTPPRLSDLPQDWNATRRLAIDCETCDPHLKRLGPGVRRGAYITGVSFALSRERGHYLSLNHLGGDNVEDRRLALGYLRRQAKAFTGEVVGANLSYDLDFLAQVGVEFPLARFLDVQVAEPLLDELQFSYSLNAILGRHGLPLKDETLLRDAAARFGVNPKSEMWKLPARYVGQYAEADVTLPLILMAEQEAKIKAQGLERVWELEQRVLPILVKMRRRGVRVDFDQLDHVERFSLAEETKAWGELARLTGVTVRVGDAMKVEPIAEALAAVGVRVGKTKTGKSSVTKELLDGLDHPAGKLIRRARKMSQLRTTFVASVREHAINGRVHCTFNQIVRQSDADEDKTEGAAYGRLSCCDPNLQQQPARDPELGPMWRKVYLPDEGSLWASNDYSSQEPRLALHFAVSSGTSRIGAAAHASALDAQRRYREDPKVDPHGMFSQMVDGDDVINWPDYKQRRSRYKNIFLGICYGEGGPKLCRELGLPTKVIVNERSGRKVEVAGDEGQAILDKVDRAVPYVKATAKAVERVARERGYVCSLSGRRLHFLQDDAGNYDFTYKAFNRIIQGSAADQTKTAMVDLNAAGYPLQLQVHDEIVFSAQDREEAEGAARVMRECVQLHVPSKVDVEVGPSWGEAK